MDPQTIMLGKYSLPVILSMVLGLVYKRTKIPDDIKPYIAVGCGMVFGILSLYYNQLPISFPMVADYLLAGAMAGFAATGVYETTKPSAKNRYVAVDENNKRVKGVKVVRVHQKVIG